MLCGFQIIFLCAIPCKSETGSPSSPVCLGCKGVWCQQGASRLTGHRVKGQTTGMLQGILSPLKTWHILFRDYCGMGGAGPLGVCTEVVRVWLCLGVLWLHVVSLKERCVEMGASWRCRALTLGWVCQDLIGEITAPFFPSCRCCERCSSEAALTFDEWSSALITSLLLLFPVSVPIVINTLDLSVNSQPHGWSSSPVVVDM